MVIIRTGQGTAWKNRRKTTSPGELIGSGTAAIPKHSRCLTGQFPLIRAAPGHGTAVRPHLATWVFFLLLSIPAIRRLPRTPVTSGRGVTAGGCSGISAAMPKPLTPVTGLSPSARILPKPGTPGGGCSRTWAGTWKPWIPATGQQLSARMTLRRGTCGGMCS